MRKVVLTGIGRMEMQEAPEPQLRNDTDVLIRLESIGVCGSDVHYYTTGRIGDQVVQYPFAVGHECAGTVVETGSGVTRVSPGNRVAGDPAVSCGTCDQCAAGRLHTCRNLLFLGCPGQIEGCLSDYIVMPEESCFVVDPDHVSAEAAAFSEPLAIGVYGVREAEGLCGSLRGARIGILGFGPIGASVLLPALARGIGAAYVTDPIDARLEIARKAGAAWTANPASSDIVSDLKTAEPGLLDVVFECCGQQEALDQAVEMLKPGGKLMVIGIPEVDTISFVPHRIRRKEICIQNIRRQNGCVEEALDLVAGDAVDLGVYITHRFGLEQTKQAFDLVRDYRDGVMKAMIEL